MEFGAGSPFLEPPSPTITTATQNGCMLDHPADNISHRLEFFYVILPSVNNSCEKAAGLGNQ